MAEPVLEIRDLAKSFGALKATVSPTALRVAAQEPPPRISPRSLGRRERSARLSSLWPNQKENPHEHAS